MFVIFGMSNKNFENPKFPMMLDFSLDLMKFTSTLPLLCFINKKGLSVNTF
jgi:hypothetical protein